MAVCVPDNEVYKNEEEEIIYNFIKSELDNSFILYHNYKIDGHEFDFLLIDPKTCLYIIEVKGWSSAQIVRVEHKNKIVYRDKNGDLKEYTENPLDQASGYKYKLINKIKGEFGFEAKVVHLVCYPRITKADFYEKDLNIVSNEEETILKDDLLNKDKFYQKLLKSNSKYKCELMQDGIEEKKVLKIRSLFENVSLKLEIDDKSLINYNIDLAYAFGKYSLLIFLKNINIQRLEQIINLWKSGVKIHIVSDNESVIHDLREYLISTLGYLKRYKEFEVKDKTTMIFNFSMYYYDCDNIENEFIILDGEYKAYSKQIEAIGERTSFNFEQYKLEHFSENQDVIVKAGAGSGKTYSMISRIVYLAYKHNYTPEELSERVALITFTNEAADNMKSRLKNYYTNYYILTAKQEAFRFIEVISKMNISTIHSLSKTIIDTFSTQIGIGKGSSITQSVIEKRKIIDEIINEYIELNHKGENILDLFQFRTFKLIEVISELIEKIEQKNILLSEGYDFGNAENPFQALVKWVIPRIQERMIEESLEKNSVRLSEMIILLKEIIKDEEAIKNKGINIDYLFIDEFQDTDNIQIDLMNEFKRILDFSFFVVGDVKQCIYRFRGAESNAFSHLLNGTGSFTEFKLIKNYRTDKSLLEKFHPIFSKWSEYGNLIYTDDDKLKGIKTIDIDGCNFEKVIYKSEQFEEDFIDYLKKEIDVLEVKSSKDNKGKTIAILVRKNNQIVKIKDICDKAGIYIDADSEGNLYDLGSTRDFYMLVLALLNNKDPKCLFNLFETNYTAILEDRSRIFKLNGDKNKLINYFKELNPIDNWDQYVERVKLEPVMKVVRELIFNVKPWSIYSKGFEVNQRDVMELYYKRNLEQLIENIVNTYNNDYLSLNKLVELLRINIQTGLKADARESVNVEVRKGVSVCCKTIHRSKGLEYDTVILPFNNKNLKEKNPTSSVEIIVNEKKIGYSFKMDDPFNEYRDEFDGRRFENKYFKGEFKDESEYKFNEETRILYVALTRAISKVVYFSLEKIRLKNEKRAQDLIEMTLGGKYNESNNI